MQSIRTGLILMALAFAGTSQASEPITGVAGMDLGSNAREYLDIVDESYRLSNVIRNVEGLNAPPGNKFRYAYLAPPEPIDQLFEGASFEYLGLVDDQLRLIEIVIDIGMRRMCNQSPVPGQLMESLRGRYEVIEANESTRGTVERYNDGANELKLSCSRQTISLRYTSDLFAEYVNTLKSEESESIGKGADQL